MKTSGRKTATKRRAAKGAAKAHAGRMDTLEQAILRMNREMGEVIGELRTLKWIMGGTFIVAIAELVRGLFVD